MHPFHLAKQMADSLLVEGVNQVSVEIETHGGAEDGSVVLVSIARVCGCEECRAMRAYRLSRNQGQHPEEGEEEIE
jgi:hypothetical protein